MDGSVIGSAVGSNKRSGSSTSSKGSAAQGKPKKIDKKSFEPSEVYLRTLADLTIHGGITDQHQLVVVPIVPALGVKIKSLSEYSQQVIKLARDGGFNKLIPQLNWQRMEIINFIYPSLNSMIPMPGPAALDHIIATAPKTVQEVYGEHPKDTPPPNPIWFDPEIAARQLYSANHSPKWRPHRLPCLTFADNSSLLKVISTLLTLEDWQPGLLTDDFLRTLQCVNDFHSAVKRAHTENQLTVVTNQEITAIMTDTKVDEADAMSQRKVKWSTWFKKKQTALESLRNKISVQNFYGLGLPQGVHDFVFSNSHNWLLLPDIGGKAFNDFKQKINRSQVNGFTGSGSLSHNGSKAVTGFLWRLLLHFSKENGYHSEAAGNLPLVAAALDRRLKPGSIANVVYNQHATIAIGHPAAFVIKAKNSADTADSVDMARLSPSKQAQLTVSPGVLRPQVAAEARTKWAKKFPAPSDRYQLLAEMEALGQEQSDDMHLYDGQNQLIWPGGRLWQMIDLLQSLLAFPEHFANPEFCAANHVTYRQSVEGLNPLLLPDTQAKAEIQYNWESVSALLQLFLPGKLNPCNFVRGSFTPTVDVGKGEKYKDHFFSVVDGGLDHPQVTLGVRFKPSDSGFMDGINIETLLDLLQKSLAANSYNLNNGNLNDLDDLQGIEDVFASLRGLTFSPAPFFEIGGQEVEPEQWFSAKKIKNGGYYIKELEIFIPEKDYLAKSHQFELRQKVYSKYQNVGLNEFWKIQMEALSKTLPLMSLDEYLRHLTMKIAPLFKQLDGLSLADLSQKLLGRLPDLVSTLRPYQAVGIAWAYGRLAMGFGICLADEMGLGKTIQAISLLRIWQKSQHGKTRRPALVVMPKSLKLNWLRELRQFGAGLAVVDYGDENFDLETAQAEGKVVLVTYPRLRIECAKFAASDWGMVILDEAHAIKNAGTQIADAVRSLKATQRMALTGTPVENRAEELWSLMDWLNPGYLGDCGSFGQYFQLARTSQQKKILLTPLRECLDPLILRRLKKDPQVALGLPDKIYEDETSELSEEQQFLYQSVIEVCVAEGAEESSWFKKKSLYLRAILHLKQICIHPELFLGDDDGDENGENGENGEGDGEGALKGQKWSKKILGLRKQFQKLRLDGKSKFEYWLERSGKVAGVSELLLEQRSQCRGILIFTQYLGAADILRRLISQDYQKPVPNLLHGGMTPEQRQQMVDEFNATCLMKDEGEEAPILILSLKAGGTGLNLTGADCVMHFDRWWNPAVEDQATDRAHRIGQTNNVMVRTFTTLGTIEESIASKFERKRQLSSDLLGAVAEGDLSQDLADDEGFLQLVDPRGIFRQKLLRNP